MDAMQVDSGATESEMQAGVEAGGQNGQLFTSTTEGLKQETKFDESDDNLTHNNTPEAETGQPRTLSRWTEAEQLKLAEILNTLRDAETSRTGVVPRLGNKDLFAPAADAMKEFFSTSRTFKGCFSHWNRYRDRDSPVYAFLPNAVIEDMKAKRKSGTASQSKKRPSISDLNEENEAGDEEDNDERTPDPSKRPKPKKKAKDETPGEGSKRKQIVRFDAKEMEVLKDEALKNAYPDATRKHELAAELNIDVKRVTRFFGNVQAGNYAWGRHLKRSAAAGDDGDGEESMLASPSSIGMETPSRQSPDAASETGKGKRRHTLTAKAMEAEQSKKKRYTKNPYANDGSENDNGLDTPSQTQPRRLSASKATDEGAASNTKLNARLKQSHHPSPLAIQATYSDEMEIDANSQQAGHSKSTTPESSRNPSSTVPPHLFGGPDTATPTMRSTPTMIKRVAPGDTTGLPRAPFDEELAKQHAANASRYVRSEMTEEQLYRANHPPMSPYDMGPIPMDALPTAQHDTSLDKLTILTKQWEAKKNKLQKEIKKDTEARKKFIASTHLVKDRYNAGNEKLSGLSKEYTNPETPVERKKELSNEFNATQKWMIQDKTLYNSMRDQSDAAKRKIEAKKLQLSQLENQKIEVDPTDSN